MPGPKEIALGLLTFTLVGGMAVWALQIGPAGAILAALGYGGLVTVLATARRGSQPSEGEHSAKPGPRQAVPPGTVAPLPQLLAEHMALISDTSEDAVLKLSHDLTVLRERLIDLSNRTDASVDVSSLVSYASDLQIHLQNQDIIRQQVAIVRFGLAAMAEAGVPGGQDPDGWTTQQLDLLEGAYVMPSQWEVHRRVLGIEDDGRQSQESVMFF